MNLLPPLPSWDALHPLIVHFPIALLIVAPAIIVAGVFLPRHRAGFFLAALLMFAIGTISAYIAVSTGEAAARVAERGVEINSLLERHETLAENARLLFTILTVLWLAIVIGLRVAERRLPAWSHAGLPLVFVAACVPGLLLIAQMAHLGGRLVHQHGVHAMLPPESEPTTAVASHPTPTLALTH